MVLPFLLSAILTWLLLFPARAALRRAGLVDRPNARSSHTLPTVRGGGVVIVLTLCFALLYLAFQSWNGDKPGPETWRLAGLAFALVILAAVSFVDDLRGLPARVRFAVQVASAIAAVSLLSPLASSMVSLVIAAVAIVWIAGYTNAFNFMDGINGIAGIQTLTTGIGTAFVATELGIAWSAPAVVLSLIVAGAAFGFLPHNFPKAKVFMGDVSSASLGFILATLAFWVAQSTSWWVLFWIGLLHANFVLDTGITLVRRALRGDKLSEAHREHFYQRLIHAGTAIRSFR